MIPADHPFASHEELGSLGGVFDQDDANLPAVQKGMKNSATGKVILARERGGGEKTRGAVARVGASEGVHRHGGS